MSVFKMRGVGAEIEIFEDKLTLTPRGLMGVLTKGLKGTKTIPFSSITATQHKKAGVLSGYLQFTVPGGNENKRGVFSAANDENTFMYASPTQNVFVDKIKTYIEKRMGDQRISKAPIASASTADELSKLIELKRQGALTEEEFTKAKGRLLD